MSNQIVPIQPEFEIVHGAVSTYAPDDTQVDMIIFPSIDASVICYDEDVDRVTVNIGGFLGTNETMPLEDVQAYLVENVGKP